MENDELKSRIEKIEKILILQQKKIEKIEEIFYAHQSGLEGIDEDLDKIDKILYLHNDFIARIGLRSHFAMGVALLAEIIAFGCVLKIVFWM